MPANEAQLRRELKRAVYAREAFMLADKLATLAIRRDVVPLDTLTHEEQRHVLWTAALVTYARAFGSSALAVPDVWRRFPDDPDLADVHRKVVELRDRLYAHTDDKGHRDLRRGETRWEEERVDLGYGFARRFKSLCHVQLTRAQDWEDEIDCRLGETRG